jgi:hypothetical protein
MVFSFMFAACGKKEEQQEAPSPPSTGIDGSAAIPDHPSTQLPQLVIKPLRRASLPRVNPRHPRKKTTRQRPSKRLRLTVLRIKAEISVECCDQPSPVGRNCTKVSHQLAAQASLSQRSMRIGPRTYLSSDSLS